MEKDRYGFDPENAEIKSFHSQRRMFLILNSKIYISPENVTWSHAKWFEELGFDPSDEFMNKNPRGYYDITGLHFYKGYNFSISTETEEIILGNLEKLANKLKVPLEAHLFGGAIKQSKPGKWPSKKDYGIIKDLIS